MKIEDFASLRLGKDQKVLVEATNGKFYGRFINFSNGLSRLNLGEVQAEDGRICGNFKFFFKKDVINVEVIEGAASSSSGSTDTTSSTHSPSFTEFSTQIKPKIKLSEKQLEQISKNINQCVYNIQQVDAKYFEAIADIAKNFVIGVNAEGVDHGRVFKTNFITVSTTDKIYVFDVLALSIKNIAAEVLKNILEGDEYLKVVYDCPGMKDNFKAKLDIKLGPVFDLLLVSSLFYEKREIVSLNNCIETVLGINNVINDKGISMKRPMTPDNLRNIATKTAYHLPMYHKLVQNDFSNRMVKASIDYLDQNFSSSSLVDRLNTKKSDESLEEILKIQSQSSPKKFDCNIYSSD